MSKTRDKWNRIYADKQFSGTPAFVLTEFQHFLPKQGRALDIACGSGANTVFLADKGLIVDAWDISDVAIARLGQITDTGRVKARAIDITPAELTPATWDVITVCHYLDRSLIPAIKDALTPGGLVFYQTFTADKAISTGPTNPDFLLGPEELPVLMSGLEVLGYQNEGSNPNPDHPLAGLACIVARKPGQQ